MRIVIGLAALAALGATAASAQTTHLSDMAYLKAARCVGLASSKTFNAPDKAAQIAWLRAETRGRLPFIVEEADEANDRARHEADRADDYMKSRMQTELNGVCASLKS